jgi:hypothetical protein
LLRLDRAKRVRAAADAGRIHMRVSRDVAEAKADAGPAGAPRLPVRSPPRKFVVRADLGSGVVSVLWPAQASREQRRRTGGEGPSSP